MENSNPYKLTEYDREKSLERAVNKAKFYKQSANSLKEEKEEVLNSYRYRLGSEIADSLASPKRLIKLPFRLWKIFKERKNSLKTQTPPNRLNEESETVVLYDENAYKCEKKRVKGKNRILYVIQDGLGGTVKTNEDLMSYIDGAYDVYLLTAKEGIFKLYRYEKGFLTLLFERNTQTKWDIKNFLCKKYEEIYKEVLTDFKIDLVHIRHLLYHSFDILTLCKSMNIPVVVSFHDFYFICPTINLINDKGIYCEGNCNMCGGKCSLPKEVGLNEENTSQWVKNVWQSTVNKYLSLADVFITTAQYPKKLYCNIYPEFENKFQVIEHGRDFYYDRKYCGSYKSRGKIKILIPGNINKNKGSEYIKQLKECDVENILELHFIGRVEDDLKSLGTYHGVYARDEFDYFVKKIAPDYVGIFSIWPETYCHVLTEAESCGMPCIVSDIGVLRERAEKNGGCILADLSDHKKTYNKIINITKKEYDRLCSEALNAEYKSINEMGSEYKRIYDKLRSKI